VLHTWGSSSRSTASGWVPTSAIVLDGLLHLDQQFARRECGTGRHLLRGGEQLVVVVAAVHQADALGLGAVHHLAEHHAGEGGLRADDAAQHPGVPAAGVDADLQEARVELGPRAARRTSQPSARFMPAPTAAPLTAASVGSGLRAMRRKPS
jgi:hypothetical protein